MDRSSTSYYIARDSPIWSDRFINVSVKTWAMFCRVFESCLCRKLVSRFLAQKYGPRFHFERVFWVLKLSKTLQTQNRSMNEIKAAKHSRIECQIYFFIFEVFWKMFDIFLFFAKFLLPLQISRVFFRSIRFFLL